MNDRGLGSTGLEEKFCGFKLPQVGICQGSHRTQYRAYCVPKLHMHLRQILTTPQRRGAARFPS